jgi:hypothetical protein
MRKLLVALLVAMCSFAAFAEDVKPASGPSAQSLEITQSGNMFSLVFLQDNKSFKPGVAWQYNLGHRMSAGIATLYDTAGVKAEAGPILGWNAITSQYFNITPMVGLLQDLTGNTAKTTYSIGVTATLNMNGFFGSKVPQLVQRGRASLLSIDAKAPLAVNGLGLYTGYNSRNGASVGINYLWKVTPALAVGPAFGLTELDRGCVSPSFGAGASVRVWGDARNSLGLWAGSEFNPRGHGGRIDPVLGLTFRNAAFDF